MLLGRGGEDLVLGGDEVVVGDTGSFFVDIELLMKMISVPHFGKRMVS